LEDLSHKHGYTDYKWIDPEDIVVSQWVRMKCSFGGDVSAEADYPRKRSPKGAAVAGGAEFLRDPRFSGPAVCEADVREETEAIRG
jgi:hypothetical protein